MKVVLREDMDNLGKKGEIVNVADGYARNFLLPRSLALKATQANINKVEDEKKMIKVQMVKEKEEAEEFAKKLKDVSITIIKKVGENQVLYGSVTQADIADKLKEEGYDIDRKKIVIEEPIKKLGIYDIPIALHADVKPTVKVWVVKE